MAHQGIFATSAECIFKMGNGYDSVKVDEDRINELCLQAESYINVLCNFNFSDVYAATLNVDVKYILSEAASNLVAIYGIQYDMSGYNSSREAENIINVNWARFNQCIKLLNGQNQRDFINNA